MTEGQCVEVREGDDEEVREGHSVGLPEAVGEFVSLLVRLAWLAVKVLLTVAEREGQLEVAEADRVALRVGVREAVEQGVGVCEAEEEDVSEEHSEGLTETVGEREPLALWLAWLAVAETVRVALSVGVSEMVEQGVGVCEAEDDDVCEAHSDELLETVGE